jgi:hypothetical protein
MATTHRTKSLEYKVWIGMKQRCTNPKNPDFKDYGARGITMCQRWLDSFDDFVTDMGPRPSIKHSIDRIENHKGYEPGNCRWATNLEQSRNRRSTILITMDGETKCLEDWCRQYGIHRETVRSRINDGGWRVEDAIKTPAKPIDPITKQTHNYKGEVGCVAYFAEKYQLTYRTVLRRLSLGWSIDAAIETPVRAKQNTPPR